MSLLSLFLSVGFYANFSDLNRTRSEFIWLLLPLLNKIRRTGVILIFSRGINDVCFETLAEKLHLLEPLFQFARCLVIYEFVDAQIKSYPVSLRFLVLKI